MPRDSGDIRFKSDTDDRSRDTNDSGEVDTRGCPSPTIWYRDSDGDGYGSSAVSRRRCKRPSGFVENDGDCDDSTESVHPEAEETCNGTDDDCDGTIDEGLTEMCAKQAGVCAGATVSCQNGRFPSCGSAEYGANFEQEERSCDGLDNDCDGTTDRLPGCAYRALLAGNPERVVEDLAVDPDTGAVYLIGMDGSYPVNRPGSTAYRNAWVAKFNNAGVEVWRHSIPTPNSALDLGYSIAFDPVRDRVYAVGGTNGAIGNHSIAGPGDGYILEYDDAGNLRHTEWVQTEESDIVWGVEVDPAADLVVVAGFTDGTLPGESHAGGWDVFVIAYRQNWERRWLAQFGGNGLDRPYELDLDSSDETVYVVGETASSLGSSTPNNGMNDGFLTKFDASGNQKWTRLTGSAKTDRMWDVSIDASTHSVYTVGSAKGPVHGASHSGRNDAFIVKRNATGELKWIRTVGTPAEDIFYDLQYDPDSNRIYVAGRTGGAPTSTTNRGGSDVLAASYSTDGNRNWIELRGTSEFDAALTTESHPSASDVYYGGIWSYDSGQGGEGFLSRVP